MLESGIIDYGKDFNHTMEEGGWDLSKIDKSKSKHVPSENPVVCSVQNMLA